jgi:hypothetical protein
VGHAAVLQPSTNEINEKGDTCRDKELEFECDVVGDHVIKANPQRLVQFKPKSDVLQQLVGLTAYFEGKSILSYGCLIAKSVHEFKGDNHTYFCNIMNTSGSNVRIKDRGVVGKLMLCEIADRQEETVVNHHLESGVEKKVRFDEVESRMSYRKEREIKKNVDSLKVEANLLESQRDMLRAVLL